LSDGQANAIQQGAGFRLAGLLAVVAGLCDCLSLPWGAAFARELRRRTQSLETWVAPGSRAELFDGFLRVMAFVGRLRPNSLIDIQDDELGRFTHVLEVSVQPPVQDLQMAVADFGLDPYLALAVATPPAQAVLAADRGESEMAKVVPTLLQASPEVLDAGGGTSRSDADAQGQAFAEDAAQVLEVVVAVGGESELATRSDDQWGREPFDARPVAAAVSDPQYEFVEEAPPDIVAQAEVAAQATECEGEPPPADRPAEVPATTPAVPESCLMGTGEPAEMVDGDGTPNVDSAKRQEPHAELPPQPDGLAAELAPAIGPEAVGSGESSEESDAARMKAEPSTGLADLGELGALMGGLLGTAAPAATQPRDSGKPAMDVATLLAPARGQPNKLDFVDSELLSIMFEEATGFLDSIDAMLALWRIGGVASEQLRGTVGEIRRVVHSLKGVIRTCGLASAGAVLHAMEDRLEITADDGLDLASDVPAYLDAMAAVRATIELGREQFESGVAGPLPETGGQVVSCDLGPVPAVQALPVPDDVLPLVPHDVVTAVPDDVAVTVEPFGDLDAVLSMPLAGLQTVVVSPDAEEPALPRAAEQSEPADQAGADTWQASAEVVGSCDEGVLLNGLLVDEARVTPAERIAAQPQPVAEVPLASDGAAMRPVALAPAALQPEADSPELASECGFAAAQLVVFPGSQEPPVAVDPSGESDADAMSSPAAGAEDGGYLAVTAAAGEPLPPTCEPAPELLPALVAVPAPEPEAILPVTAAVPSAAAALAAVVAPLAAQYPAGPSAPAALPKGDGSVRIPLRLANRVGDASGQLQAAGRRAQEELDRAARQMRELQENLVRMGGVIRELDILAAASLPASSVLPAVQGFDPLEMDRYGALQEQVRRLLEAFDDTQASAQGLAEDLRRTQGTEEERAEVSEDLQRDASELTLVDVGMQRVRLERTVAKACSDAHRLARLVIEPGCRVPGAALDKLMWVFEHLLRNAVAHGIEPSDARETAGKPAAGTITIGAPRASANADGSVLRIAVRDDGRGIDHDRVLSIAVSRGLALRGMAYTREQIRNFLFMPGFSTASAVSELAGRGVGLDVVRAALATLGGMVAIDSEDGQGAEFVLTLPTDSASMAVIPVSASGYRCLLPLSLVTRVVSLSSGEDVAIDVSGGRARVANSEYPMITLASRVPAHDGTQARQGRGHLVLMSESQSVTGVLVDTVGQQSRVVVRQLGPIVRDVPGMVAGTALPDGQVGLVVNPLRLQAIERQQMAISAADTARTPHVLVVDDSATVRLVTSRFLKRLGYQTTAARDGVEALQMIDNGLAPDGILLDLEMPGIDGFELLAQLRSLPRFSTVPMVVISSRVGAKYGDRARELGATAYLAKPYEDATLQRLLSKLFVKCADSHVPI
jgi:chemotaxis protein histidine kinase CheA